jgi:mono/diheme cytochrome c family protein
MRAGFCALGLSCFLLANGCSTLPGKPAPGPEVPRPESILSSHVLYAQNCAGCHGRDGLYGPATPLASPVYQSLVDDATLRRVVAQGEPGSMMPAFAKSAGGDLTDAQVDAIVRGMRADWKTGETGESVPPYADDGKGSVKAGEQVYASNCARCHGPAGGKIGNSGSVLNPDFLSLMTPQGLRTAVIVGRPDLGMPDWRNQVKGKPMNALDVSNVVAFLVAQKPGTVPAGERTQGPQANQGAAHQPKMSGGVR